MIRKAKAGRIVSLSTGMGSPTLNSDPTWVLAKYKMLGYCGCKAAAEFICAKHRNLLRSRKREVRHRNCYFVPAQIMDAKLRCHLQRIGRILHG